MMLSLQPLSTICRHVLQKREPPPRNLPPERFGHAEDTFTPLVLPSREELTVDYLRAYAQGRPRTSALGMIQLDLSSRRRMHIWGHPGIPKSRTFKPGEKRVTIHDHVFGFRSTLYKGRMTNKVYELDPDGSQFRIYQARVRQGDDTVLQPTPDLCDIRLKHTDIVAPEGTREAGMELPHEYVIKPFEFHDTIVAEPTVTIIDKDGPSLAQRPDGPRPRVLVPVGQEPDNVYTRYMVPPERLWEIIEEVLRR